jgi:hypothetical protein
VKTMVDIFLLLICALFIGFLAAAVFALVRWRGIWRFVALLPLFIVSFIVVRIVVDTQADPTSHNLWPLEVVVWSFLALAFLGVLFGIRSLMEFRRRPRGVGLTARFWG